MKTRIIERVFCGEKTYVIQQRSWAYLYQWCDAWCLSWDGALCRDSFPTLKEAQRNLCYFDGTRCVERVIEQEAKP